ncbi:MAG: M20 family metallopeptidase [Candidatus Hydrogenedentes bacterium]|nr:M20 family metallopeptidase [Candidatus Hydrogenedentota bacterium]
MNDALSKTINTITPEIASLRHELHEHPEIRFEEIWTSDRIAKFLDTTGVPYQRGFAKGTGIVATLQGGAPGKTVLLRADMDALEIQEETGLPYASKIPERMHACGHDGHSACLCGVVKTLAAHRDRIKGTVKFVFQPGEEEAAGGRLIVEEGVLDGVDAAFALHGWPTLPIGHIGIRPGAMLAGAGVFKMIVHGKGCHAADPAAGVDPIVAGAHIVTALQSVVSREINPWDAGVVSVTKFHGGTATNITPESAVLEGTYRSLNDAIHQQIEDSIRRIAEQTAAAMRATVEVRFSENRYPVLFNDPDMTQFVIRAGHDLFGEYNVTEFDAPYMGAEDFSYYLQKAPGAFVCLGVNPNPGAPYPPLHNPKYDFGDAPIPVAMRLMSNLALRFLESD